MAGIYIHIPFCRKACHYCNFHFSTSLRKKDQLLDAIIMEIKARSKFFEKDELLSTIYFGGGTPSILNSSEISRIIKSCRRHFTISKEAEISLEANPDDLDSLYLEDLKVVGVNRLSIGIQSFHEGALHWMNRSHNSIQAKRCLEDARNVGFENISLDLIYGIPSEIGRDWNEDLDTAFEFDIPHYSCYALTVEEKTPYAAHIKKNKSPDVNPRIQTEEFEILMTQMEMRGYVHYEISNFAKLGHESCHNSSYWNGDKYLGIGPAAHSFDGKKRYWNISHNPKYIAAMSSGESIIAEEELSARDLYNEYVMTSLRRKEGCTLEKLTKDFELYHDHFKKQAHQWIEGGFINQQKQSYSLTTKGKHFADRIASDLFYVE